ncbi:hypothetical protein ACOSQ3_004750 [Xanthoceras sorbifolium]
MDDAKLSREAEGLALGELSSFEFILSLVIWHDILSKINMVSKKLQSVDMHVDITVKQLEGLVSFFEKYRENGFNSAMITAKEIALKEGIELYLLRSEKFVEKNSLMKFPIVKGSNNLLQNLLELIIFLL